MEDFESKDQVVTADVANKTSHTENFEEKVKIQIAKYDWIKILVIDAVILSLLAVGGYTFIKSPQGASLNAAILGTNVNYSKEEISEQETQVSDKENSVVDEMTRKHEIYEDRKIEKDK